MKVFRAFVILLMLISLQSQALRFAEASSPSPDINCDIFPADSIWNTAVNTLPVDTTSTNVFHNFVGTNRGMHADFGAGEWEGADIGIPYVVVDNTQPMVDIEYTAYGNESDAGPFPVPADAPIEGGPNSDGDRHVLVVNDDTCMLYELYRAFPQAGGSWEADSGAVYDLNSHNLRPDGWTSADAAGLPILPGLVRYEEIVAGSINHAIRFTLSRTADAYVWPARHEASSYSPSQYLPMGARLRLRADFNISGFDPEVQIILQAMKTYGIILADNGSNMYISGAPDSRWDDDALRELGSVTAGNFEVVDTCSFQVDPDSGQAQSGVNPPPNNCTSLANGGNQFVPTGVTTVGYGNPLYQWLDIPGAQYYYLFVNNSSGGQVVNEVIADLGNCDGDTCSFDPTLLRENYRLVNGTYYAYINTWNGTTLGTTRGPFAFTLNGAPPTLVSLDVPTNVMTLRPSFSWTLTGGAANATYFNVYVAPVSNSAAPVINQWLTRTALCGSANGTSCSLVSPVDLMDGTSYNLYVRSYGPGGISTGGVTVAGATGFAGPQNFTVNAPTPNLPSGITVNTNQGRATINWNDDPNATYFYLSITNTANTVFFNQWLTRASVCTPTCTITPAINLANGNYQVIMSAYGPGGVTNNTAPVPFTFNFGVPNITEVVTFAPQGIINTGSPTFSWNSVAGVTFYYLWVGGSAPSFSPTNLAQWYDAAAICTPHPGTCTVSDGVTLAQGNYSWRLQGYGPGGLSAFHNVPNGNAFTVTSPLPIVLTLNAPTGTITSPVPTFTWGDDPNVDWYNVIVNSGTTSITNQWYRATRGAGQLCNADTCSLTLTGITLANASYVWNVRGYGAGGTGAFSNPSMGFAVNIPAPTIPVLVTPASSAVIHTTNRPTFVWNTSTNAVWYNLEVKNGMNTVVFTQWYQAGVGGCTVTTCTAQLPNPIAYGGYTWAVRAWSQGGLSNFSTARNFFSLSLNPQPLMIGSNDGRVQRSGIWTETNNDLAVEQTYLSSSGSTADTLTFAFSGTAAEVVYITGPSYGSFVIEVDGVPVRQVNSTATQVSVGSLASISGLSAGEHTLRILPLNGATIAIDGVFVDGAALSLSAPQPIPSPTIVLPTMVVTDEVTVVPSATATDEATIAPTDTPTAEPTVVPTDIPTEVPTDEATQAPMAEATLVP